MTQRAVSQASPADTAKLALASVVALLAVVAFYYFAEHSLLARVVGLLAAVGVALGVASTTELGGRIIGTVKDSRTELRKVVWPSRAETLQTSLAVVLMVIVMGILLWLLDMGLLAIVRAVTGQGG